MSKEKSAVFIGHIQCTGVTRQIITPLIENMIAEGVRYFYSGGMGAFDRMTANAVFDLKKKYPDIKNYLVIPYQNFKVHDRNIFDEIILPNGEQHESNVYYISAIPKRSRLCALLRFWCSRRCHRHLQVRSRKRVETL